MLTNYSDEQLEVAADGSQVLAAFLRGVLDELEFMCDWCPDDRRVWLFEGPGVAVVRPGGDEADNVLAEIKVNQVSEERGYQGVRELGQAAAKVALAFGIAQPDTTGAARVTKLLAEARERSGRLTAELTGDLLGVKRVDGYRDTKQFVLYALPGNCRKGPLAEVAIPKHLSDKELADWYDKTLAFLDEVVYEPFS